MFCHECDRAILYGIDFHYSDKERGVEVYICPHCEAENLVIILDEAI